YLYQPARRDIDIGLLARCMRDVAVDLASRLESALTSFKLPVEALCTHDALLTFVDPLAEPFVVEIRQHEEVVPLRLGGAYALHRLTRPFLLVAQVASADPLTATALAQAFAAEMCERITAGSSADSGERLPSNFDLVQTRTLEEVDCARSTLTRMRLSSWGAT